MFTGPKFWNSLDQSLKEACSLNSFKYGLKMLFTEEEKKSYDSLNVMKVVLI